MKDGIGGFSHTPPWSVEPEKLHDQSRPPDRNLAWFAPRERASGPCRNLRRLGRDRRGLGQSRRSGAATVLVQDVAGAAADHERGGACLWADLRTAGAGLRLA